jgi:uncharacterized protein (TIGR02996 family)
LYPNASEELPIVDDRQAFIQAICECPEDDTLRLVFADWLEEHGETDYSTFIRVQCEMARFDGKCVPLNSCFPKMLCRFHAREVILRRREQELYQRREPGEWGGVILERLQNNSLGLSYTYRRGFVAEVRCTLADWWGRPCEWCSRTGYIANWASKGWEDGKCRSCHDTGHVMGHGPAIVQCQPVEEVVLTDREPYRGGAHTWYNWTVDDSPTDLSELPTDWIRGMKGVEEYPASNHCRARFATLADAKRAASRAALAWAKEEASRLVAAV